MTMPKIPRMPKMRRRPIRPIRIGLPLSLALLSLTLTACPLDEDPSFDDWCGAELCHWDLVQGNIQKVATWNDHDYGVSLVGPQVTLIQQTDISSVSCLEFKVIADLDPAASVYLEMSFTGDGTNQYRERIPSAAWQPLTFLVAAPTWYDTLAVTISKESDGRAVLARLEVNSGSGCTGTPIPLDNRPAGAWCETAGECTSGTCAPSNVCTQTFAACDDNTPCAGQTGPCVAWPATCQ
jgi:hypothetical protein